MSTQKIQEVISYDNAKKLKEPEEIIYFNDLNVSGLDKGHREELKEVVFSKSCVGYSNVLINGNYYQGENFQWVLRIKDFCKQDKNSLIDKIINQ
jgi:hypothetical protein